MTHERTKKNKGKASEMNLAAILMCIVFIFLICNFPRIMLNVHEFFMTEDIIACEDGELNSHYSRITQGPGRGAYYL